MDQTYIPLPGSDEGLDTRSARSAPIRVVLVDDFQLVREGFAAALDRPGEIEVVGQASNGDDALRLVAGLAPDVVVLDMGLPLQGGRGLLVCLRRHPGVRALVLTARDDRQTLLDAISDGAAGFLSKRATGAGELCEAVAIVADGGSVITPSLAPLLLTEYAVVATGGQSSVRPPFTGAERDMIRLIAQGMTDHELSRSLAISPRTVQNRLARLRARSGIRQRSELTAWAAEQTAG
jgi:DNA-binding NarL/FixJ family response regulator